MDVREFVEPRTHVIAKDFLTKKQQDLLWSEIRENESNFEEGKYKKNGKDEVHSDIKKNLGFDVSKKYPETDDSHIRSMFYHKVFNNDIMIRMFSNAKSPVFQSLRFVTHDRTKVSAYGNEDFYGWHVDGTEDGILTVLYMICKEPKKFTGGDLILKWGDGEKTVPFENNTLIIFPRNTIHTVTDIKMKSDKFYDKRFTIQCFANFK